MAKTCPECGLKNNDSSKECTGCYTSLKYVESKENSIINGSKKEAKLIPIMCPYCGAKMKKNSSVCPSCYKDVNEKVKYSHEYNKSNSSSNTNDGSSIRKKITSFAVIALIVLGSLYGYGYWKAGDQLKKGTLNLFVAGMTIESMNPVSARGYRSYLMNKTDIKDRLKSFDELDF